MSTIETKRDATRICGPHIRTSAARAGDEIGPLWQRFFAEGWLDRLPRMSDDSQLYAVYTDYESDFAGAYTMILGVAVRPEADVPEGARSIVIPTGKYARFAFEGDPKAAVWGTWNMVNTTWERRSERLYAIDFETHTLATMRPYYSEGAVVVGLR